MIVVRADIETLLIEYLAVQMGYRGYSVPVADQLAAGERTDSLAVVRYGGPMRADRVIDNATIEIAAKGATPSRSSELLGMALAIVNGLEGGELGGLGVARVQEYGGPASSPRLDAPTRYIATLSVEIQAQIV